MGVNSSSFGDPEIRLALRDFLSARQPGKANAVVIEELGLCRGQVRVDFIVLDRLLHGFEIKSDKDTLRRLRVQVELYSKVLDKATLVVGNQHLCKARQMIPDWWGILMFETKSEKIKFRYLRKDENNPSRNARSMVELLWLEDAMELLILKNVARGFRGKPRPIVWDRVCKYYGTDEIAKAVRRTLRARKANRALALP